MIKTDRFSKRCVTIEITITLIIFEPCALLLLLYFSYCTIPCTCHFFSIILRHFYLNCLLHNFLLHSSQKISIIWISSINLLFVLCVCVVILWQIQFKDCDYQSSDLLILVQNGREAYQKINLENRNNLEKS